MLIADVCAGLSCSRYMSASVPHRCAARALHHRCRQSAPDGPCRGFLQMSVPRCMARTGLAVRPLPAASTPPYCAAQVQKCLMPCRRGRVAWNCPDRLCTEGVCHKQRSWGVLPWKGKALPEGQALTAPKATLNMTLHVRQQRPGKLAQGAPSAAACCCRFRMTAQAT